MISCLGIALSLSYFLLGYIMMYNWTQYCKQYSYCEVVTLRIQKVRLQKKYCYFAIALYFSFYACKLYAAASYKKCSCLGKLKGEKT